MKATELETIYNQLDEHRKQTVGPELKNHLIAALAYFYEEAQIGDNPLELKRPIPYDDRGNDVYEITGIEMMFSGPKGEMVFHQQVESEPSEVATNPLEILSVETLLSLMKAYEKQGFVYDEEFNIVK